jgi:hypothetical protein
MIVCVRITSNVSHGIDAHHSGETISVSDLLPITGLITIFRLPKKYATKPALLIHICGNANHISLLFLQ